MDKSYVAQEFGKELKRLREQYQTSQKN